jgi:hypothetical protein
MLHYKTKDFDKWDDFMNFYRGQIYQEDDSIEWIFRGQLPLGKGEPELATSLERALKSVEINLKDARQVEKRLEREFKRRFPIYVLKAPPEDANLEWFALMQHHGAPTRLLDWTYSFWVATYFAIEKRNYANDKYVVWAMNLDKLKHLAEGVLVKGGQLTVLDNYRIFRSEAAFSALFLQEPQPTPFIWSVSPMNLSERLAIQQGMFLCPGDITYSFEDNLSALGDLQDTLLKVVLRGKDVRKSALKHLHSMNMSSATLFPGLDGFARSLWMKLPILMNARVPSL